MWRTEMTPMQTGDMEIPTMATDPTETQIMVMGVMEIRHMGINLMGTVATMMHQIGR